MRWLAWATLALLLLLAAYTVWPFYGLYQIAHAVEARNAAALRELVEFPMLRRSLTEQIVLTYLKLTGKDAGLGAVGTRVAVSAGATVADPIVAQLLNPESLLELLDKGAAGGEGARLAAELAPMSSASMSSAWRTWLGSEYSGRNFYVALPPDKPAAQQFRVKLYLIQAKWKLAGIDLPEALRLQLAQQVMKAQKAD